MTNLPWAISTVILFVWLTLLYHCLTSDRHQGSEKMNWTLMLILAAPIAIPAYIYVMFLRQGDVRSNVDHADHS